MREYQARLYELVGDQKFPETCPFNTSGPGTARGTHILFLTEPGSDETYFGNAIEEIGDPAVYGLLVYDGAISGTARLFHSHKGTIRTEDSLDDSAQRLRRDYDCVTGRTRGEVREYWEALLLDQSRGSDEAAGDFDKLVEELDLESW